MLHSFDTEIAVEIGLEKAIILQNISFWINKNIANKKHLYDGKTYTYNSYEAFAKLFPYMKLNTIKRVIRELEDDDILVSRNDLNESKHDKTKWYSFGSHSIVKKITIGDNKNNHGQSEKQPSIKNNNQRQIVNTDSKPYIKQKNNIKKDFTFNLTKNSQFNSLSENYQERLRGYAVSKDGAYCFEAFLNHHLAKGSQFKDWSRAYNTWLSNSIKFSKFNPKDYIYPHHDTVTDRDMFKEYGTNKLFCPKSFEWIANIKILDTIQEPQLEDINKAENSVSVSEMMQGLAQKVRTA